MKSIDLTGERFGMLVVLAFANRNARGMSFWKCLCDCGTETTKSGGNLRSGHTKSCGCKRSKTTSDNKTVHAMYGTPTYKSWSSMHTRCSNEKNHKYPSYGGRGISVCERWKSFSDFLDDMGIRPEGTTLGRKDNDGNYDPSNCEWQSAVVQGRNKRNTALFEFNGVTATIQDHCERLGLNASTVRSRIYTYKWPLERAFSA